LISGCTSSTNKPPTISKSADSEYVKTFKDLHLGILFNFDFKLPNADKSWVTIWVERYQNGEKNIHPITELSYGLSPNEVEQGNIGFGMINYDEDLLVFL
jgi:hypothetical protein